MGKLRRGSLKITQQRTERTSRIQCIMIMMITEDRDTAEKVLVCVVLQETGKME